MSYKIQDTKILVDENNNPIDIDGFADKKKALDIALAQAQENVFEANSELVNVQKEHDDFMTQTKEIYVNFTDMIPEETVKALKLDEENKI